MKKHGQVRIGTSGWQYSQWRDDFYPHGLPQKEWLEYYVTQFDTVEINNTFYRLPRPEVFDSWARRVPRDFVVTLKYSRYGTHIKRLADPVEHIPVFLMRAERLGKALGPILVQLPPNFLPDLRRLEEFLKSAPGRHRWVVEFRNPRWLTDETYDVLRKYSAALCIHDLIPDHPRVITSDFVYLRYHGGKEERGRYSDAAMGSEAKDVKDWLRRGLDVFAYFNNDAWCSAPKDAENLREHVGQRTRRIAGMQGMHGMKED